MGLQKKELSEIMVSELQLTCTPEIYLQEAEKLHHKLFPNVSNQTWQDFLNTLEVLKKRNFI